MATKKLMHILAAVLVPALLLLSACTQDVQVKGQDTGLVGRQVTEARVVVYPNDNPSIPDGKLVWESKNCSVCHAVNGRGVAYRCQLDLTDLSNARRIEPKEQYMFIAYGREGVAHRAMKDDLSRKQIWDLVFYVRNLSSPYLAAAEIEAIDPVFGSNCAVCHGTRGYGDGPLNKTRNFVPLPANFHQFDRFYERTDEVLWDHIAHGIKWEGMPDFLGKEDRSKNVKFDDDYIWRLVQYVRHFHSSNTPTLAGTGSQES